MTHNELEHGMQFILQQHGRFEASFQKKMDALLEQQAQNASDVMQLRALGTKLARAQLKTERIIAESHRDLKELFAESHRQVTDSVREVADSVREVADSVREVAKLQRSNEIKLNTLASAMERQYGNGRGRKRS